MRPLDVLETCLYARDLDPAERFYRDVLRLTPYSRAQDRHVFFRCGARMVLIFNPERTRIDEGKVPPHGTTGAGHVAFAIRESELEPWRLRLLEHGVAIEKQVTWPGGGRSLYFRDPAGNSVELATPGVWKLAESEVFPATADA